MAETTLQIDLEKELRLVRKKIEAEPNLPKKSRLINAYEDLVDNFKA
jgi:hypothetical protein